MPKKIVMGSALLALAAATAIIAVSASGSDGWQAEDGRANLEKAFPSSAAVPVDRGVRTDGEVVAQARLTEADGTDWLLSATAREQICASSEQTTTCQPSEAVSAKGVFMAAVDCRTKEASVSGLVPEGVTSVTALGSQTTRAVPSAQGVVHMTIADSFEGLSLSNGATNPMSLDLGVICNRG